MNPNLIQVSIDSIRVSLVSPHRIVVLKDDAEHFLPIWIGPFEADAIRIALEGNQVARPLTHDLFKNLLQELGGTPSHIVVTDLRNETFFANIIMNLNGKEIDLDSRPSDAIALAVRFQVPMYVEPAVMKQAAIRKSQDTEAETQAPEVEEKLDAFRDLFQDLDLDGLGKNDSPKED